MCTAAEKIILYIEGINKTVWILRVRRGFVRIRFKSAWHLPPLQRENSACFNTEVDRVNALQFFSFDNDKYN